MREPTEIHVPTFKVPAGGAALTAWQLDLPNNVGIDPDQRLLATGFDDAREAMEQLAEILTEVEDRYQALHTEAVQRVQAVVDRARERASRGPTDRPGAAHVREEAGRG